MSNLPERIKAWPWNNHTYAGQWHVNGRGETTEYVRADLFDAVKDERDDELLNIARQAGYQDGAEDRRKLEARVKALAEALEFYADRGLGGYEVFIGDYGLSIEAGEIIKDGGDRARAALQENTDDR